MSDRDIPDGTDGREAATVAALAALDHRGRQAGAALRAAAGGALAAERAASNGHGGTGGTGAALVGRGPAGSSPAGTGDEEPRPIPVVPAPRGPATERGNARRPLWLAAAAVVLVALAGAVLATRSDGGEPVAMSQPGDAYLAPGWLPDGWQARQPVLPEPFNTLAADVAVYGAGDAEDPWAGPLLRVMHFTDGSDDPPSHEGEPITIGGREGVLFEDEESGEWIATNGELAVSGHRGATREQVVAAAGHATEDPAIAPAGLPEGYRELARGGDDAVAGTLDGVERGVVVSYGEGADDALGQPRIEVLQRAGEPEAVDLARLYTESSRATTVRGQHAVIAVTSEGVHLQWREPPGMLVTVDAQGMTEEETRRFAEELRLAQPDEVEDLTADNGVEDGAPAWPYEGTEPPSGDASAGETGPATPAQDRLRAACTEGSMSACDELWQTTPVGSDLEAYAETCGGRDPAGGHSGTCEQEFGDGSGGSAGAAGPTTTTPEMEQHRAECASGSMAACDELWRLTPLGSELEAFAETCGGRDPAGGHQGTCEEEFGPGS